MADLIPWSNLLAPYNSPNQLAQQNASIQQTQAQTGYVGAQTQGQDLQNQLLQSQLNYRQQLPDAVSAIGQGSGNSSPPAPGSLEDGGLDAGSIQNHIDSKFYVNPAWTPQEARAMNIAMLSGQPGATDAVKTAHDMRIQNAQAASTKDASTTYDNAQQIATAPAGTALTVLNRFTAPDMQAAQASIKQVAEDKGWTPEQTDQHVREIATEIGGSSFMYSKYAAKAARDEKDGVYKDERGREVLGSTQSGLSQQQRVDLAEKGSAMVDVGAPQKVPLWQANGARSLQDWVQQQRGSTGSGAPPSAPSPSPPQGGSSGGNLVAPSTGAPAQPNTAPPAPRPANAPAPSSGNTGQAPGPATGANAPTAADPWKSIPKIPPELTNPNSITTPILKAQSDALVKKDSELRDSIQEAADNGNNRLQLNADAARALPNAATGPTADWLNDGRKFLVQLGVASPETAQKVVDTTTLNKDLTQNALQSGKLMFGSKYTESEVGLMLTKANASGEMTPQAIHELLLQDNLRSQYAVQKQADYERYTSGGGDPRKFDGWYNTTHSLQKFAVQNRPAADAQLKQQEAGPPQRPGQQASGAVPTATGPNGQKLYLRNGQWVGQ
jgi:hypothetical protein